MKKSFFVLVPLLMIPVFGLAQGGQSWVVLFGGFVLTSLFMLGQQQNNADMLYDAMHYATDSSVSVVTLEENSRYLRMLGKSVFGATITLFVHSYLITGSGGRFFLIPVGYFCLLLALGLVYILVKGYISGFLKIVAVIIMAMECLFVVSLVYDKFYGLSIL